jgi:hypothetical protein
MPSIEIRAGGFAKPRANKNDTRLYPDWMESKQTEDKPIARGITIFVLVKRKWAKK